jgi:hypothetical protein
VLVRILVDGVVEKIGANPAVIEQRIPFARRAVADDLLAVALGADQEVQQLPLRPLHLLAEFPVGLDVLQSFADLTILQRDDAVAHRLRVVLSMAAVDPQRAAVRRQLLDVGCIRFPLGRSPGFGPHRSCSMVISGRVHERQASELE